MLQRRAFENGDSNYDYVRGHNSEQRPKKDGVTHTFPPAFLTAFESFRRDHVFPHGLTPG